MKLGFYTNYDKIIRIRTQSRLPLHGAFSLARFKPQRRPSDQQTDSEVKKDLKEHDIEISALGYYPNYLDPDKSKANEASRYFYKVMELANRMGVNVVCTFAGREPNKSIKDNIPLFKEIFTPFCEEAERRKVRIAIENCPMMDRFNLRGENIAISPEVWDEMYRAVPSKALGIELDPSHMVWQGIDYIQAIYDYGDRIFHIHAKDMEINRKVLKRVGILGQAFGETVGLGHGWWRARLPGWGEMDWPKFMTALIETNYKGNIDIEHEDDVFAAASAKKNIETESGILEAYGREEKGLILGYNTLSKLIPPGD